MINAGRGANWFLRILLVVSTLLMTSPIYIPAVFTSTVFAGNRVMGEIQFEGRSKIDRTAGVWVDGEYVGYLKELKGSKKVLLLPGEHVITVRQNGYQDFTEKIAVQPGQKHVIRVAMEVAATGVMPAVMSTVKITINPSRAAVFLDGLFVGHCR